MTRLPAWLAGCAARGGRAVVDGLFPPACVLCGEAGVALCGPCRHDAVCRMAACCPRCAIPLPVDAASRLACGRCVRRPPAFDLSFAAATYEAPFDQLLRGLKYGATLAYAPMLAALVHARLTSTPRADFAHEFDRVDVLLPVPMSRERIALRGFNQSIEVARPLAALAGKPLDTHSVLRIHDTSPQASLRFDARRRNIRGAFHVVDACRGRIAGARIGVVDDVMTTGATLDELARTLKRAGATCVVNLVVARTP